MKKSPLVLLLFITFTIIILEFVIFKGGAQYASNTLSIKGLLGVVVRSTFDFALLMLLMIILPNTYIRYALSIFYSILNMILMYFYSTFGYISPGMLSSIFESSPLESIEYLSTLNIYLWFFIFLSTCIPLILISKYKILKLERYIIVSIAVLTTIAAVFNYNKKSEMHHLHNATPLPLYSYMGNFSREVPTIKKTLALIKLSAIPVKNTWGKSTLNNKDDKANYIVIIGESVRFKEFYQEFNLLGKEVNTQHWNIYTQATSPATQTRFSISRLLSINKNNVIDTGKNVIGLSTSVGFNVSWFSNQGDFGEHDTPISRLAKKATHYIPHNRDYSDAKFDGILLNDLSNLLSRNKTHNMVFLHMIGSHPNFCERVDYGTKKKQTDQRICYNDSIKYLLHFISGVEQIAKKYNNNYKIIYLSDHGLTTIAQAPYKIHGTGTKFSKDAVHVPLVFINSKSKNKEAIFFDKKYYLRDFPHTFAEWAGINNKHIKKELNIINCNNCQDEYIYDGLKKVVTNNF